MKIREKAREMFKACGLTYADVKIEDICMLFAQLSIRLRVDRRSKTTTALESMRLLLLKEKNIKFKNGVLTYERIEVVVYGNEVREAITFNEDGFIAFAGWADDENILPFVETFVTWCNCIYRESKLDAGGLPPAQAIKHLPQSEVRDQAQAAGACVSGDMPTGASLAEYLIMREKEMGK